MEAEKAKPGMTEEEIKIVEGGSAVSGPQKRKTVSINIPLTSVVGTMKCVEVPDKFPQEKKQLEQFIAREFAQIQKIDGLSLAEIRSSADDTSGRPDILADLGGRRVGLQLKELKIPHRPHSRQVVLRITQKLLAEITQQVRPSVPLFVNIHSPSDSQNQIVRLRKKQIQALANAIVSGIRNKTFSDLGLAEGTKPRTRRLPPPRGLEHAISFFKIAPIPEGHTTGAPGTYDVHVNFNFHNVAVSNALLETLVNKVLCTKLHARSDILLIWYRDKDFWRQGDTIAQMLRDAITQSSINKAYLLGFEDFGEKKTVWSIK